MEWHQSITRHTCINDSIFFQVHWPPLSVSAKRVRVIPVFEYSTCNLTDNHQELKLMIRDADAIFWDEAPMQHRYIFEAVHRTV
jgi:chloramphenicol O-acetyltransferase